eukprot:gnl/MRDRNA2_/MRDRNA2_152083_c0_seq1.p1 gnl/MRDRNA2_/MRDRNA2_152083_c0~~gnl/MRDRNA2_/MRDRNA2_152083_c0_seq1.p1  ORF type:complete len:467 (+),score=64.00 gnl/MRDRNA2_/MRDRNA2_152083_c0_seq1:232-1632(+)
MFSTCSCTSHTGTCRRPCGDNVTPQDSSFDNVIDARENEKTEATRAEEAKRTAETQGLREARDGSDLERQNIQVREQHGLQVVELEGHWVRAKTNSEQGVTPSRITILADCAYISKEGLLNWAPGYSADTTRVNLDATANGTLVQTPDGVLVQMPDGTERKGCLEGDPENRFLQKLRWNDGEVWMRKGPELTEGQNEYEAAKRIVNFLTNKTARRRRLMKHLKKFQFAVSLVVRSKGMNPQEKMMDLKYWIEAADKKHRYGARLVPYYKEWLHCESSQGFLEWLDHGNGKTLDLEESPRDLLVTSNVEYLDDAGRAACEVTFVGNKDGKKLMVYKATGAPVHTPVSSFVALYRIGISTKYIYVCDLKYRLYVHKKKTGCFHHSSFLSGRPARAAGGLVVKNGTLLVVNGNSGHYKPTVSMQQKAWRHLEELHGLDHKSYLMVYPRTRKVCPSFCKCSLRVPANFPW